MCGRARCTLTVAQAARAFGFPTASAGGGGGDVPAVPTLHIDRFRPSYNVSPGAYLPVGTVRARPAGGADGGGGTEEVGPVIQCMKWGLVPSFTGKTEKPDHFRMFNARSESVKEKASFRRLIPKNRCLVAVEGFFEWKKNGSKKQPYYIHFQDHRSLVFAALYDTWTNSEGETIYTFTILTIRVSTSLKWLHDRMPVILGNKDYVSAWLNDASINLEQMTAPYEGADLVSYPVTSAMGKTSFDGPECIKEVSLGLSEKPISKFFTKKSTDHNQPVKLEETSQESAEKNAPRGAKVECQSVEIMQQQPGDKRTTWNTVENELVTMEPQVLKKTRSIRHEDVTSGDLNAVSPKRKIEDTEVNLDTKMENSGRWPSRPMKKGSKSASEGQSSLLSYFAKK